MNDRARRLFAEIARLVLRASPEELALIWAAVLAHKARMYRGQREWALELWAAPPLILGREQTAAD